MKLMRKILGIIIIIIGIAGLFLPILQGIALIMFGLWLLGSKRLNKIIESKLGINLKKIKKK